MKRISFLMVALMLVGGVAMARGHRKGGDREMDPKARVERMTERMAKEYSLNDAQKKELLEVNTALMDKAVERKKSRKEEAKASREAYDAQLKKIMTNDQYAAYTKKQAERGEKMRKHRQRK